jgi:hypothetical protein
VRLTAVLKRCIRKVCLNQLFLQLIFILSACSQTGCGMSGQRDLGAFEKYVTQFEEASVKNHRPIQVIALIIRMGSLPKQTLALCTIGAGAPLITVNQERWSSLSESQKSIVLNHEFGHCVLNKKHNDASDPSGVRKIKSIMNAHPLLATDYSVHAESYLAELFSQNSDI